MTQTQRQPLTVSEEGRSAGFYGIFVASFIVFLFVALAAQLLARDWRTWFPGSEGDRSMIDGVKASVYTFMSYLS